MTVQVQESSFHGTNFDFVEEKLGVIDENGPVLMEKSEIDENALWGCVLDEVSGKPRLGKARRYFGQLSRKDLPLLTDAFMYWSNLTEYLVMKGENVESGKIEYFAVKASKRGNDVFASRLDRSLGFLKGDEKFFEPHDFETHSNKSVKTRLLWNTLTYDSNRCSLDEAWENIGSEFNLWITNLRNKYGKIHYVAFPQAFPGLKGKAYGYPHFHVILLFEDHEFSVFRRMEKDREGKLGIVYRIEEKDELESQGKWHSFTDVKALSSMKAVWNYAKKHCYNAGFGDHEEAVLNNSIMWNYRKRSFCMSGEFRKKYAEFIKTLHNSKTFQETLEGKAFPLMKFTLIGVFSASELGICENSGVWSFDLERDVVEKLLIRYRTGYKCCN